MYINTFKYTPKDVSCQLCTEYVKKLGCTALRCPWLAERIEAGVVGYREAVLETFSHERRLFQRLNLLIKHYPGSLWSNEQHERRMQYQCAVQGYRRRRDTNAYYAAMYLLTSNDDIYRRTANCFCKDGIEFGYDVINEADAKEYIPIGMELEIDGRKFVIDSVNFGTDEVSLRDVTFQNRQGFPIFRAEHIAFIRSFVEEQEREQPQPVTKPVAFYPAEKTHLPYDIEIQTLHIPEPEHDPPSAEPAEPEPPAMSDEERLILEQEGRAALSEMGEFVPDFDDAISQAEIDEPPAHRPAVSIPVDGEWQGFPSVAAAEQAAYADFKAASHRDAQNFHITDDALGVGGAKAKFRANMAAIRLLQELEFEGLQASPEQQEILSRYVGWGGLADAFDENKPNWSDEFAELYATLSPEEYAAARASTLNAHYTSPTVIKAIYEAVGNMGFQSGNILEPSMGVGNFFGLLPEQMQGSKLYGVELDSITGRIAKQLYPKADITIAGFETTDRKDFYDLAVGNVPFGQYQVNDLAYNKLGFSIHDYFFAKTLDQVRPGGVIAFVTSR